LGGGGCHPTISRLPPTAAPRFLFPGAADRFPPPRRTRVSPFFFFSPATHVHTILSRLYTTTDIHQPQ